jgi:hypothetical protein
MFGGKSKGGKAFLKPWSILSKYFKKKSPLKGEL